jgi:hypothetical protein
MKTIDYIPTSKIEELASWNKPVRKLSIILSTMVGKWSIQNWLLIIGGQAEDMKD